VLARPEPPAVGKGLLPAAGRVTPARTENQQRGLTRRERRGSGGNPRNCWGLTASKHHRFCPGSGWIAADSHPQLRPGRPPGTGPSLAHPRLDRPQPRRLAQAAEPASARAMRPGTNHTKDQSHAGRITPGSAQAGTEIGSAPGRAGGGHESAPRSLEVTDGGRGGLFAGGRGDGDTAWRAKTGKLLFADPFLWLAIDGVGAPGHEIDARWPDGLHHREVG